MSKVCPAPLLHCGKVAPVNLTGRHIALIAADDCAIMTQHFAQKSCDTACAVMSEHLAECCVVAISQKKIYR